MTQKIAGSCLPLQPGTSDFLSHIHYNRCSAAYLSSHFFYSSPSERERLARKERLCSEKFDL